MSYQINLLSRKKESPLNRAVYFSLNYLRYILVITQIVVIAVFLVKFKVDQEIIDLQEAVDQKKEIVTVSQPLITLAKSAHIQGEHIESVFTEQKNITSRISEALSLFPKDLFLQKINIDGDTITLDSFSDNISIVQLFIAKLKKNTHFKSVELKVIKKTSTGFETTIELKKFSDS